jgi:uncharacterized protein (DUF433 family)
MARDLEINDGRPTSDKPEDFSPEYKTGFRDGGMSRGYISLAPLVTAHPHVMSGTPCVIGRRIPTATVAGNFSAGTPLAEIAKDYRLQMPEAEAALRYEFNRIAKRKPRFRATQTLGGKQWTTSQAGVSGRQ